MIRRMCRAQRNPSSCVQSPAKTMGFAALYSSYVGDQAAVGGSGSGGAPVAPPPIVPTIASARPVSENGVVREALAPWRMPQTRGVSCSLDRTSGVEGKGVSVRVVLVGGRRVKIKKKK